MRPVAENVSPARTSLTSVSFEAEASPDGRGNYARGSAADAGGNWQRSSGRLTGISLASLQSGLYKMESLVVQTTRSGGKAETRKIHRPVMRPGASTECRYNSERARNTIIKFEKRHAIYGKIAQLLGYAIITAFYVLLCAMTLRYGEQIFTRVRMGAAQGFVSSWFFAILWDLLVVEFGYALLKLLRKLSGATYLAVVMGVYNLVDWYEDYCDLTTIDMMAGDKNQKMLTTAMEDNEQMY